MFRIEMYHSKLGKKKRFFKPRSLRGKSNLAFELSVQIFKQIYLCTCRQVYTCIDAHTYSYGFIIHTGTS